MKKKTTYTLRTLITELFCKVHNNEMDIPEAVEQLMALIEGDVTLPEEDTPNSKIDPLFKKGNVPLMDGCSIQETKTTKNGGYKYFILNSKSVYGCGWVSEDELIKRIVKLQKKDNDVTGTI